MFPSVIRPYFITCRKTAHNGLLAGFIIWRLISYSYFKTDIRRNVFTVTWTQGSDKDFPRLPYLKIRVAQNFYSRRTFIVHWHQLLLTVGRPGLDSHLVRNVTLLYLSTVQQPWFRFGWRFTSPDKSLRTAHILTIQALDPVIPFKPDGSKSRLSLWPRLNSAQNTPESNSIFQSLFSFYIPVAVSVIFYCFTWRNLNTTFTQASQLHRICLCQKGPVKANSITRLIWGRFYTAVMAEMVFFFLTPVWAEFAQSFSWPESYFQTREYIATNFIGRTSLES